MISFDVVNGFSGMRRDIILKLCRLMWNDLRKIRTMIGMCHEHFRWKNHPYFVKSRPHNIHAGFRPSPPDRSIITSSRCVFIKADCTPTVFLDKNISTGVFRWTITINYSQEGRSDIYVGSAPVECIPLHNDHSLGFRYAGDCSLQCRRREDGSLATDLWGARDEDCYPVEEARVPDGSMVAVEVDTFLRTISFFVGEKKIPHAFSNIRTPLCFGASGTINSCITLMSLRRLPASTPSPVVVGVQYYLVYPIDDD